MGDGLKKGMITRIHLENFGTYDKVTVKPEKHANVIMGPNGSGKSIVAAIVLGLGGKPNIIGRALHVGEYVKSGRDSARIEIHLKNGTKQDSVVTRTITKEGKSTWMINGNQANDESVKKFTFKLNIQFDNLCHFLSQDKVQDFSKMDAQALLENTERSVGDPKLLEYHLKLKEQRTIFKALEVDVANTKRLLESKTQRRDELQQVVATIEERKLIKKKIVTLKQKKAWILYDLMQRKLTESKKNRDLAVKEMQKIEAELKPLKNEIKQIKSEMITLINLIDDQNKKVNAEETKLSNIMADILSCENKIENVKDTKEIESIMKKRAEMSKKHMVLLQKCFDYRTSNIEAKLKISLFQPDLLNKENDLEKLNDKFTIAETTFLKHEEKFQLFKREVKRLYEEASTSTNNSSLQNNAFNASNKGFEELPTTLAETDNELTTAKAKILGMARNMDAETIPQEYQKIQNDIQKLTELVKKQIDEQKEITREIEILKQKWFKPLRQLLEKINANFSSYFFAMDCAGEVTLSHGENVLDFDQYGLEIKVKLRDADELQELTKHFQSGGERMATIAIYMIALQELSRVPFRCVDEINQGMDSVNERRVFKLLIKMAGRPGSSQYFLFTPKESLTAIVPPDSSLCIHFH